MKNEYVFFLGGHDAEMYEIKKILEENKISFFDNNLKWGAKLSDYKTELSKLSSVQIPVLVELNLDVDYPSNAIVIDHHNEKAGKDKKTSIEQVAELLGVKLNREQELISANDKGCIWGMIDIGATENEIKMIRERDMEQQGVTDQDKEKAKISVDHFLERISSDMVIVNSLIENTTPITELIYNYYKHIFIITPSNKLSYSGTEQIIRILEDKYTLLKKDNSKIETWSGGYLPDHGYFGANQALDKMEIVEIMEPFIEKERIHSQHIFMFPFLIENKEIKDCPSSRERLKKIYEQIKKDNNGWEYNPFKIALIEKNGDKEKDKNFFDENGKRTFPYSPDETWAYNEYNYFYESVRKALFNQKEEKKLFDDESESPVSLYYERNVLPTDEMCIYIKGKPDPIKLSINHLSLRIFETGIGILTMTLYNTCTTKFEDILIINDFGRRIYPQFLGEQEYNQNYPENKKMPVDETKDKFLADKIIFTINGQPFVEEFPTEEFLNTRKQFASYLEELLKPLHTPENLPNKSDSNEKEWNIKPIIDDRMYTISWYENNLKMWKLQEFYAKGMKFNYEDSRDWYMYTFIDGKSAGIGNDKMRNKLIGDTAYSRFIEDGTIFGISRYSFVGLCSEGDIGYNVIRNHLQKMYYQMCVLLLAQRASIIKFNNDIENISEDADKYFRKLGYERSAKKKEILVRIEKLNRDVILFSSRIWFDEVTPQEQGIELYALAHKNMNTESQLISLRKKISDLHDFITMKLEQDKTTSILQLTKMSTYFVPLMVLLTFWCMDFYFTKFWRGDEKTAYSVHDFLFVSSSGFISSVAIVFALFILLKDFSMSLFTKEGFNWIKILKLLLWVIVLIAGIIFLMNVFNSYHK
ncbi:MAG: hypothetical protein AB1775_04300 [Bacteroidota bacterium]